MQDWVFKKKKKKREWTSLQAVLGLSSLGTYKWNM